MKCQVPLWIQLIVFTLLVAVAGTLWVARDTVSQVFANAFNDGQNKKKTRKKGGQKVHVVVATVVVTTNDTSIEAIGTGRAKRFITLYPETTEEIVHFAVRAGDRVKQGQTIVRLDERDAELAVNVAKTKLDDAQRLLKRSEQLHTRKVNSQAKVDDARTLAKRAELELDQAEETLAHRTIKAPFDGIVGIPKVEPGDRVSPSTAVITLDDRRVLLVEFEVPELYLARLSAGQKIIATTPSFANRQFEGRIDQVDSRINPTTRSITVRAAIPNNRDLLRPGMSFAVEIHLSGKSYPTVPELAFLWGKGTSYVWRVNSGKAEQVPVRIVKRLNSKVLVDGDIAQGDFVVVEGVQRLRPGKTVTFKAPPPLRTSLNAKIAKP